MAKQNWFITLSQAQATDPEAKRIIDAVKAATSDEEKAAARAEGTAYAAKLTGEDTGAEDKESESDNEYTPEQMAQLDELFIELAKYDAEYERTGFETIEEVQSLIDAAKSNDGSGNQGAGDSEDEDEEIEEDDTSADEEKALMSERAKIIQKREKFLGTKLAKMSTLEQKEFNAKEYKFNKQISEINRKLTAIRRARKMRKKKDSNSNISRKQAEFLSMLKRGISITNIVKTSEFIRTTENLIGIMTPDFVKKCDTDCAGFAKMWGRWKQKFIDNKATAEV